MDEQQNLAALFANLQSGQADPQGDYLRLLTELMSANNFGGVNQEMEQMRLKELGEQRIKDMLSFGDSYRPMEAGKTQEEELSRVDLNKLLRGAL